MRRGELYRVKRGNPDDPKPFRVYVIVSRQAFIETRHSSVICAPIHTSYDQLATQVEVGVNEGLKHFSSIHCDELISLSKRALSHYVGRLSEEKINELNEALKVALELDE
jgi:mRNA interferase MazF